jgi:hypothetical protein
MARWASGWTLRGIVGQLVEWPLAHLPEIDEEGWDLDGRAGSWRWCRGHAK